LLSYIKKNYFNFGAIQSKLPLQKRFFLKLKAIANPVNTCHQLW